MSSPARERGVAAVDIRIRLAFLWVALMLAYLLGDVLRIYAGDFVPGEIGGVAIGDAMWLAVAVLLAVPIAMVLLSLVLERRVNRWVTVVAAIGLFAFNAVGLPTYPGLYDQFLIVVGLALNAVTIWTAWRWTDEGPTSPTA